MTTIVSDVQPCRGCGKTLSECYDMPRYKGELNCCKDCDHPTLLTVLAEHHREQKRREALAKLTDEERNILGV